ncbi:MAG: magnesium transporter [Candidatus Lernaella stagnicola]|nr:magnesium transporter [Candidatus Lernaella stagnicola]
MQQTDAGSRRVTLLSDTIRRLIRRRATVNLLKIIKKTHAADLAFVFKQLNTIDGRTLFELLPDPATAADVLSEMEESVREFYLERLNIERLAGIFQEMSTDDAASIMDEIEEEERRNEILALMKDEDSEEVEELLSYGENTAGRIMSPDFFALEETTEARDAIREIRKASEAEMVFYVYVVDEDGRLEGVVSLRELVTVPPEMLLSALMNREIVSVEPHVDQEEVARLVARYNLLAIPVVNDQRRLIGIVTVDDVVDIMRDEATEDILKMVGTSEEDIATKSALRSAWIRLPWLFASWIGGVMAARVIAGFSETLAQMAALAAFIPVVVGMGGNIGIQSASITIRGLATHRIEPGRAWRYVGKEVLVGLLLGVVYGVLLGVVSALLYWGEANSVGLGIATGMGILCSMLLAAVMGSFLPLLFNRMRIDPAVASGPFITTAIDVIGVSAYFLIATLILL